MVVLKKILYLFKWEGEYHISPFHLFLASLIVFPVLIMKFSEDYYIAILYLLIYVIYSVNYYVNEAKEHDLTVWNSFKNDLPSFSKVDISPWQLILFLLIAAPFLFFFGTIIWSMLFG